MFSVGCQTTPGSDETRTIRLKDGSKYTGELVDGIPHGPGTLKSTNGMTYKGEFVRGRLPEGTIDAPKQFYYRGELDQFLRPHGQGEIHWVDGRKYTGEFDQGQAHGKGKLTFGDGKVYQGEFRRSNIHGKGVMIHPDGSVYRGQFKHDNFHGPGTLKMAGGMVMKGEFYLGHPHGSMTMTFSNGDVLTGNFAHGKLEGKAQYVYDSTGSKFVGQYRNSKPVRGTYYFGPTSPTPGDRYYGQVSLGNKNRIIADGMGTHYFSNGARYEGRWKQGRPHGLGIFYYPNGTIYQGNFDGGVQHGRGVVLTGEGKIIEGRWERGKYVGGSGGNRGDDGDG